MIYVILSSIYGLTQDSYLGKVLNLFLPNNYMFSVIDSFDLFQTSETPCSRLRQKNHESVVKSVSQCVYNFGIFWTVSLCSQAGRLIYSI